MFSGIIEEKAQLLNIYHDRKIVIKSLLDHSKTHLGDSIAINGVCLTVVKKENLNEQAYLLTFDLSEETFRRTTFSFLRIGSQVNLERALIFGERVHGHLVYGHVDCMIELNSKRLSGDSICMEWKIPFKYKEFIVEKGSLALAGVSLTVADVFSDTFTIYVIPHTLSKTNLTNLKVGDRVNLEVDMLSRYVIKPKELDEEFFKEHGFEWMSMKQLCHP